MAARGVAGTAFPMRSGILLLALMLVASLFLLPHAAASCDNVVNVQGQVGVEECQYPAVLYPNKAEFTNDGPVCIGQPQWCPSVSYGTDWDDPQYGTLTCYEVYADSTRVEVLCVFA